MNEYNNEELWCVCVIGPDDLYPCRSRAHAIIMAEDINAKLRQWTDARRKPSADPNMIAIVEPWPHSAAAHARGLMDLHAAPIVDS